MTSLLGEGFRVRVYTGCTTGFPEPLQKLSEVLLMTDPGFFKNSGSCRDCAEILTKFGDNAIGLSGAMY